MTESARPHPALLVLRDGRCFRGEALGARGEVWGEVVFNTAMAGYQEILTDPSYRGQIVVMTYPHIGNYGVNAEDVESRRPWLSGFVVKEATARPSSWRSSDTLEAYLTAHGIVGIQGIDTRALTRHLRNQGAQDGLVSSVDLDEMGLRERAQSLPRLAGRDLVREVTSAEPWEREAGARASGAAPFQVVAYDAGIKLAIVDRLAAAGCAVTVVPAAMSAEAVLARRPDGILLSNGPGDPEAVDYLVAATRRLVGRVPIFGICLGHQIVALASGARTYKLPFGHHGANHPVRDLASGRVEITSQNHGFAVDPDSLGAGWEVTHVNLNDGTCEGLRHREGRVMSVQYHPEASPGPHDSAYLFERFMSLMVEAT